MRSTWSGSRAQVPQDIPLRALITEVHVPRDGHTRLVVVRKTNSGRSEAINAGINAAVEPLVAVIDADSILEPDALLRVSKPFTDDPTRMVATGGTIRAVNGSRVVSGRLVKLAMPKPWLARIQVVEYLRAFLIGRTGWSRLGMLILISGAFGMFRRDVVVEVGGLDPDSIGEDFELMLHIHRHMIDTRSRLPRRVRPRTGVLDRGAVDLRRAGPPAAPVAPRPVGDALGLPRDDVPPPLRPPRRARPCRTTGCSSCSPRCWRPSGSSSSCSASRSGSSTSPTPSCSSSSPTGWRILVTLAAMSVEEWAFHRYTRWRDLAATVAAAVLENFGYRQLTVFWRLSGWWASLRGKKQVWGVMTRTGFDEVQP